MGTRAPSGTTGAIIESLLQLFDVESTRPSSRSAVVVVALQYEPASYETPGRVLDELRRAGIVMHSVVQPGGGMGSGSGRAGDGPMLPEGPSPLADITARMVRTQILADGPRQSGGIEVLVRTRQAAAEVFRGVADQLLAQYRLTYVLPEGVQPSSRLEVKLLRNGGRLRAPTRVPN